MRLAKIYEIITENYEKIKIDVIEQDHPNVTISSVQTLRQAALNLNSIPALKLNTSKLLNHLPFATEQMKTLTIPLVLYKEINTQLKILKEQIRLLTEALESSIVTIEENFIYFKLPEVYSLDMLVKDINLIDKSFNQLFGTINRDIKLEFKGFDCGTEWLVLKTTAPYVGIVIFALNFAMKYAFKCIDLKKEAYNLRQIKASTEVIEMQSQVSKAICESYLIHLTNEFKDKINYSDDSDNQHENHSRILNSMKDISTLFVRGANFDIPLITQNANDLIKESAKEMENDSIKLDKCLEEILLLEE